MADDIPDYIKHIKRTHADFNHLTWCGKSAMGFCFTDLDHAAENGLNDGRLVACKDCTVAAIKALQNAQS